MARHGTNLNVRGAVCAPVPYPNMKTFDQLGLIAPILKAVHEEGYTTPTPIQAQAIPYLLDGRDLLGCAQTGTGKTAAFAIPILQHLHPSFDTAQQWVEPAGKGKRPIRALILTPTRELAIQIGDSFKAYGRHCGLRYTVVFGGVGQKPQTDALRTGVDILVATPGRLLDLMGQGYVRFENLTHFVLDEADRMLDMGFIHDVKRVIAKLPHKRQTLLFSATMPPEVAKLAHSLLHDPVKVEVAPQSTTAEKVQQQLYFVEKQDKSRLIEHLLNGPSIREVLVFTRTKHGANKLAKHLVKAGIHAEAIHGNKSQSARQNALNGFKKGKVRALVATDIAARGIDIDDLQHVINYDLPNVPETYVHRIGRTGRAGASGTAISFCDREERAYLKDIEKLIGLKVPVVEEHPFLVPSPVQPREERGGERRHGQRAPQRPQHGARDQGRSARAPERGQGREGRSHNGRPQGRGQGARPRKEQDAQRSPSGRPDYAAMTRELFAEDSRATKKAPEPSPGHQDGRDANRKRKRWFNFGKGR